MISYQFAYLIGDLILLPLWLFLFFYRKDLRREILLCSLLFAVMSPISDYVYISDYWHPQTFITLFKYHGIAEPLLEDFLFGFFIGGIATSIYEEFWGKKYAKRINRKHHWRAFIPFACAFVFLFLLVTVKVFGINSMHASALVFFICALVMVIFRKDLWLDALMSGLLTGLVMFLGYLIFFGIFPQIVYQWWKLQNTFGVMVWGVPIEELLWGFGLGAMIGPMYEFFKGLKLKNLPD